MFGKKKNQIATVQLNELAPTEEINELALVEIKDEKIISRVKSVVPKSAQILANGAGAAQAGQLINGGVYQAILPSGAKLVSSQNTSGAVRGFFRNNKAIQGQAEFMAVDGTLGKIQAINIANAAMGVASMVVGQYYMKEINDELLRVNESIEAISVFQKSEYKSRVLTLMTQVKRCSDYQSEILESKNQREEEIIRLQQAETTCLDLLNQANIILEDLTKTQKSDFEKYSKSVNDIAGWQKYQGLLINILYSIADLNYVLHLGAKSPKQCYSAYEDAYNQSKKVVEKIKNWHLGHEKRLGINTDMARYEREGIDKLIHTPFGLINSDLAYKHMSKEQVTKIRKQRDVEIEDRREYRKDLYNDDVKLIIKDGKIFYLPAM